MNANVVSSNAFAAAAREVLDAITNYTSETASVKLVEGDFDVKVQATYPAASAAFVGLDADGAWTIEFDSTTGKFYLVAPDPGSGWDFVSVAGGVTISGFTVTGLDTTHMIGAQKFETPIPVGAVGEHVTLPWVALDVTQVILDAITPYALP